MNLTGISTELARDALQNPHGILCRFYRNIICRIREILRRIRRDCLPKLHRIFCRVGTEYFVEFAQDCLQNSQGILYRICTGYSAEFSRNSLQAPHGPIKNSRRILEEVLWRIRESIIENCKWNFWKEALRKEGHWKNYGMNPWSSSGQNPRKNNS